MSCHHKLYHVNKEMLSCYHKLYYVITNYIMLSQIITCYHKLYYVIINYNMWYYNISINKFIPIFIDGNNAL